VLALGPSLATGYGQMSAAVEGKSQTTTAQRISFFLHHGRWPGRGMLVRHTCDVRACVNPSHLEEGTPFQNFMDSVDRGSRPPSAVKLNEEAVRLIRNSPLSNAALAAEYGMRIDTIAAVRAYRRWAHVDPLPKALPRLRSVALPPEPEPADDREALARIWERRLAGTMFAVRS
jgi:hypothetical protein